MPGADHQRHLLPETFRTIGLILTIAGAVSVYLRFGLGYKPDFLTIPVFAVYSSIFEAKYFEVVGNNVGEEIGLLLLLIGLFFQAFSRLRVENERTREIRYISFIYSIYLNSVLLLLSILFLFGWGFMAVMAINLFSFLIFYNLIFRYLVFNEKKKSG